MPSLRENFENKSEINSYKLPSGPCDYIYKPFLTTVPSRLQLKYYFGFLSVEDFLVTSRA